MEPVRLAAEHGIRPHIKAFPLTLVGITLLVLHLRLSQV